MVWLGVTAYQVTTEFKYRRGLENLRQTGSCRKRPERIPASAPTSCSQISTSLRRARSRGFYWRARFHELRFDLRRRVHHRVVSVARSKPRRAAPGIWVIPSILAPTDHASFHASYHLSHHLNSVIYEGQAGRMSETLTVLQPVFARLGGQGQVCS